MLKNKSIQTIFSGIESLLDFERIMLELFEQRISRAWNHYQILGDIFQKHFMPAMDLYVKYCNNYQSSIAELQKATLVSFFLPVHYLTTHFPNLENGQRKGFI